MTHPRRMTQPTLAGNLTPQGRSAHGHVGAPWCIARLEGPVLYHIRIAGPAAIVDLHAAQLDGYDVVSAGVGTETVLSCRLPDAEALTGLVALLHDLDLPVTEMAMVPEIDEMP